MKSLGTLTMYLGVSLPVSCLATRRGCRDPYKGRRHICVTVLLRHARWGIHLFATTVMSGIEHNSERRVQTPNNTNLLLHVPSDGMRNVTRWLNASPHRLMSATPSTARRVLQSYSEFWMIRWLEPATQIRSCSKK